MKSAPHVHLGFEVDTGKPVAIPIAHLVITGQTQQAGKTTALEALITRSGLRAVTFVTKRGEQAFAGGRRLQPFFRERADWVFVSSLIDATMGGKNRLLHSFLMKACRNTATLADVRLNIKAMQASARRSFDESIYTQIDGYLDLVVPQISQLPPAGRVEIGDGLNVMDLSPYSPELQALVIRSVLEHVYQREHDVVTVIPEAWEFIPEGRGSPVKADAEVLIRKGASLRNFVWIDSQDLAGVWKTVVRAAAVCLVGVQREANEIKRTLANIPAGIAKPKAADVATLELGQFYACWGRHAVKVYAQPAWMNAAQAEQVATGALSLDIAARLSPGGPKWGKRVKEDQVNAAEAQALRDDNARLARENEDLRRRLERLEAGRGNREGARQDVPPARDDEDAGRRPAIRSDATRAADLQGRTPNRTVGAPLEWEVDTSQEGWTAALYRAFKEQLIADASEHPALLCIITQRPELEVRVKRQVVEADGDSLRGRIGRLIADGFFDQPQGPSATIAELRRRGAGDDVKFNTSKELVALTAMGFLVRLGKTSDTRYEAVPGMKVNIVEAA